MKRQKIVLDEPPTPPTSNDRYGRNTQSRIVKIGENIRQHQLYVPLKSRGLTPPPSPSRADATPRQLQLEICSLKPTLHSFNESLRVLHRSKTLNNGWVTFINSRCHALTCLSTPTTPPAPRRRRLRIRCIDELLLLNYGSQTSTPHVQCNGCIEHDSCSIQVFFRCANAPL